MTRKRKASSSPESEEVLSDNAADAQGDTAGEVSGSDPGGDSRARADALVSDAVVPENPSEWVENMSRRSARLRTKNLKFRDEVLEKESSFTGNGLSKIDESRLPNAVSAFILDRLPPHPVTGAPDGIVQESDLSSYFVAPQPGAAQLDAAVTTAATNWLSVADPAVPGSVDGAGTVALRTAVRTEITHAMKPFQPLRALLALVDLIEPLRIASTLAVKHENESIFKYNRTGFLSCKVSTLRPPCKRVAGLGQGNGPAVESTVGSRAPLARFPPTTTALDKMTGVAIEWLSVFYNEDFGIVAGDPIDTRRECFRQFCQGNLLL